MWPPTFPQKTGEHYDICSFCRKESGTQYYTKLSCHSNGKAKFKAYNKITKVRGRRRKEGREKRRKKISISLSLSFSLSLSPLTIKSSQSRDEVKSPDFLSDFPLRLSRIRFSNFKGNLTHLRASRKRKIEMLGTSGNGQKGTKT